MATASNFIGGPDKYPGTVEHVNKSFGFIRLDNKKPVARAFFDRSCTKIRVSDLTNEFSDGTKIMTNIIMTDGEHKVKYKAVNISMAVPEVQRNDPSIRGGDSYLRKYMMDNGAAELNKLVERLQSDAVVDNCPRFLKNGSIEDVKKVAACNPDIFQIINGFLCLSQIEREIADEFIANLDANDNEIPIEAVNGFIRPDHKNRKYLHTVGQWNNGIKDFISRNAEEFVFWENSIWRTKHVHGNGQLNARFKKNLAAVKYYSEFVIEKAPIPVTSLMGHWNQANDEIKKVTDPRPDDFTEFLEDNSFFFVLRGGSVKECPEHRLSVIDDHWCKSKKTRLRRKIGKKTDGNCSAVREALPNPDQASGSRSPAKTSPGCGLGFTTEDLEFYKRQSKLHPAIRVYALKDTRGKGGEEYLKNYLLLEGPKDPLEIVLDLSKKNDPNCPIFLKFGHFQELCYLAQQNPTIFAVKNGILCLTEIEEKLVAELLFRLSTCGRRMNFQEMKYVFSSDTRRYLFAAHDWQESVKNFIARHAEHFICWQDTIWEAGYVYVNNSCEFEKEMKAVKYYARFIKPEGTEIVSLVGHYAQASQEVREAVTSSNPEFTEFLKRNSFFFNIYDCFSMVKIVHKYRMQVIDKFWLNKAIRNARINSRSPAPVLINKPVPAVQPSVTAWGAPENDPNNLPQVSKAFSDFEAEKSMRKPMPCSSEVAMTSSSHASRYCDFQTTVQAQPPLLQRQHIAGGIGEWIYSSTEAQIFKQIAGDTVSSSIRNEILSRGQSLTLNCLLLLRMNIGKPPMAKFRIPGETSSYNCTLKTDAVKMEDMQKILRQKEVVKSDAPCHYGVKGTLHSIRTMEQSGKLAGLTLFCQLHMDNDGLTLDIWKGKKFTAVFTGSYPTKYIYNYLRCRCKKLSDKDDVLVLDVDGQLSGCDDQPHSSLGGVARILCSSSTELSERITDAIQHMHEYVVVIGIDSVEQLKSLQKMCSKDTRVIAVVSSDLKSEVETMFT